MLVEVLVLQTLLMLVGQAARALARQPEPLAVQAVCPVLPVLTPLLEDCSGKVVVVAAVVLLARAVLVARAVVALVVVAVVQHAVHMPLAPVV